MRTATEQALAIYRSTGNQGGIADALSTLGIALADEGDLEASRKVLTDALAAYREIRYKVGVADSLANLGCLLGELGELEKARGMQEEALGIYRQLSGAAGGVAMSLANEAGLLYWEGNLAGAEKAGKEAFKTARAQKIESIWASALSTLGEIRLVQDNFQEAKSRLEEARAIHLRIIAPKEAAATAYNLARLAMEEGRFREAAQLAREASDVFRKGNSPLWVKVGQALLAESLAAQGMRAEAEQALARVFPLPEKAMDVRLPTAISAGRARAALGNYSNPGHNAQATQLLETALREAKDHGYLGYQFEARLALGEIEIGSGNSSHARQQMAILEEEARAKGFALVARKAAIAGRQLAPGT
jgi:tetratricopeptide (TPR) repeat protein